MYASGERVYGIECEQRPAKDALIARREQPQYTDTAYLADLRYPLPELANPQGSTVDPCLEQIVCV